jgi:pyruvate dehydrogenase E1 component alpha subunit
MTKQELIDCENNIIQLFEDGEIPYLTHFCGGNEEQLISIFKDIKPGDYIFSTHRAHYHYLLAGGKPEELKEKILAGKGMYLFSKELNFLSTSIVAGGPCIAAGIALGLKMSQSAKRVWCFVGDGAEDEGHFYEAVRFVEGQDLPCIFVIEDNDRSVTTPKKDRYGDHGFNWNSKHVIRYTYTPVYPHAGTNSGKMIKFKINEGTKL